jgi:hypothetical protein
MKIRYNKKRQWFLLGYGMIMLALGIVSTITNPKSIATTGILFGLISLAEFAIRHFGYYGIVDEEQITKGNIFKTVIKQNEITKVRMFAGDIEIFSKKKRIVFDKNQIDKSNLHEVEEYFRDKILEQ